MLHALDLTRSFQAAKTPWQAVSENDNEAIECAPHGFAKAPSKTPWPPFQS